MTEENLKAVTFKLPRELVKKIDQLAKEGDRKRAAQVRRMLSTHPLIAGEAEGASN